jgi:ferredoxin
MAVVVLIAAVGGWLGSTHVPVPYARLRPTRSAGAISSLSTDDPRVLTIPLDRNTGIDFGCDLSLRWCYVLGLVADGSAARTGLVNVGDQLVAVAGDSVIGMPIGDVMDQLAAVEGSQVELTFFRDTRETLQSIMQVGGSLPTTSTITVKQPGKADVQLQVPYGANLRDALIERKINCYQSITRWTNCNGQQLCGTCIVNVAKGVELCTRRSIDEASTLRENPETYKLACVTNVYGDITVELLPKVGAAQVRRMLCAALRARVPFTCSHPRDSLPVGVCPNARSGHDKESCMISGCQ